MIGYSYSSLVPRRPILFKLNQVIMASMASVSSTEANTKSYSYYPPRPRKFAPLDPKKAENANGLPRLRGVIFDVDGTLCLPQNYMFKQMREALQIPKSVDILDHIRSLSDEPDQSGSGSAEPSPASASSPRSRASAAIQAIERSAMTSQTPQPGLVEIMTYLDSRKVLKGLCTRNFPAPVDHLIQKFLAPHGVAFAQQELITRDAEGIQPKPSPEGLWSIAKYWSVSQDLSLRETTRQQVDGVGKDDVLTLARKHLGNGLIMVGDSIDDMASGYRAGAATVLLVNDENRELANHEYTDLAISRLDELVAILEEGFVGRVGS